MGADLVDLVDLAAAQGVGLEEEMGEVPIAEMGLWIRESNAMGMQRYALPIRTQEIPQSLMRSMFAVHAPVSGL